MRSAGLIFEREFAERVGTRAFWIATLLVPLLYSAALLLPVLLAGGGSEGGSGRGGGRSALSLALVDAAPPGVAQDVLEALRPAAGGSQARSGLRFELLQEPLAAVQAELLRRMAAGELDGWLYLPADLVERGRAEYRARGESSLAAGGRLREAVSSALRRARYAREGLPPELLERVSRGAELDQALVGAGGAASALPAVLGVAPLLALLLYGLITAHGSRVLQSVVAEKSSRLPEVILTSARASELLLGKILGVTAAAGVQAAVWLAGLALAGAVFAAPTPGLAALAGAGAELPRLGAGLAALFAAYFALGFLLYASLYAALGAAVRNAQEAMPFTFALLAPLLVPVVMIGNLADAPRTGTATALGLVPLSSPVAMLARLGAAPIPPLEIAASLALLAASTALAIGLAARIYRAGVLGSGRRLTLRELLRAGRGG